MARKALIAKQKKLMKKYFDHKAWIKKMKHPTKYYNRCQLCWRAHWYIREFGVCRCCFRKYARLWQIMWVKKASW